MVSQFTPTQRLLTLTRPAAARDVAGALRRHDVEHVGLHVLELQLGVVPPTSFSSRWAVLEDAFVVLGLKAARTAPS
jgi:hypothetical protein